MATAALARCPRDESCPAGRAHDSYSAYHEGCRSPAAREDHRVYEKRRREKRNAPRLVDGTGTRRRIRALQAIGWRTGEIAKASGTTAWQVQKLARTAVLVSVGTATAVAGAYEQLSGTPGPSDEVRRRSLTKGWAPPLAWDDIDDPRDRPKARRRRA